MRKKDFISYLVSREDIISNRFEQEFLGLLQGMFSMHIDGTSGASNERGGSMTRFNMFDHDRIFIGFSTSSTPSDTDTEDGAQPERVPLDEDEPVPDMTVESNVKNVEDKISCVVCRENMKNTVFLGCNHSATCIKCANSKHLKECPLCRKKIEKVIRIF
jgi:ssDNA-binding Zn-finger/Zn-ribbon topoisomerase 1